MIGDGMKLLVQALLKVIAGIVLVGALLFIPAGTPNFWQGWLLMGVLFLPMIGVGFVLLLVSPKRLEKRLSAKETQKDQVWVVTLSGAMFIIGFVLAGLNVRLGWYLLPKCVSLGATVVFLFAYLVYLEVIRENRYLSRTIEVQEGQQVVDTGLYKIVRHPMYGATLLLFLMMPLILGSVWAFLVFLAYPFMIAQRIRGEERLLEEKLDGYRKYKEKVRYRLIPFIW